MKFVWEEKDIILPRKYSKPGIQEVWMLGWISDIPNRICSISMLDGMIVEHGQSRSVTAELLTKNGYVPLEYME